MYAAGSTWTRLSTPAFDLSGDAYPQRTWSSRVLGCAPAASVSGYGYCKSHSGTFGTPGKFVQVTSTLAGSPLTSEIFNYKTGYKWGGQTYNADVIDAAPPAAWTAYTPDGVGVQPGAHLLRPRQRAGLRRDVYPQQQRRHQRHARRRGQPERPGSGIVITPVTRLTRPDRHRHDGRRAEAEEHYRQRHVLSSGHN
jgi:hypothetical protein